MSAPAPWKEPMLKALERNRGQAHSRYLQLATVQPDGLPSNRTVVFRGFLHGSTDVLTFVTDSRSRKVAEIAAQPVGEAAWYFTDTREQFRLRGRLSVVGADHAGADLLQARQAAWARMSDPGRQQFAWPQPGQPRTTGDEAALAPEPPAADAPALPTFLLVCLDPDRVDHVTLADNARHLYTRSSEAGGGQVWASEFVTP